MKLGIQTKLMGYTSLVILLVGGSISAYTLSKGREKLAQSFQEEARFTTSLLAKQLINELYQLDIQGLTNRLAAARLHPEIEQTFVLDSEGVVLADGTNENPLRDQKLGNPFSQAVLLAQTWQTQRDGDLLWVGGPIHLSDGVLIGYLQTAFALKPMLAFIAEHSKIQIAITLAAILAGIFLSHLGSKRLASKDALIREIEERKRAEAVLMKTQHELIQSAKLATVGQLASGIAHEINNPLQAIQGNLETEEMILKELSDNSQKELKEIVTETRQAAERAQEIIQGVLTFARPSAAKEKEDVSAEIPLKEALNLTRTLMDKYNVQVETIYPAAMPRFRQVNRRELMQVFVNVMTNAVRAMTDSAQKKLKIIVDESKDKIRVAFEDTGRGIPQKQLGRVFEPFYTTSYKEGAGELKGTGLGLAISQRIVQNHHGQITVQSEVGKGSTFTVVLPA